MDWGNRNRDGKKVRFWMYLETDALECPVLEVSVK